MNIQTENNICLVELNHGACNEIGLEMLTFLENFVNDFDPNQSKAVIMYSSCDAGFCAGADLRSLYQGLLSTSDAHKRDAELKSFMDRIHKVFYQLDSLPVPLIAVTHGVCFGGGFELALTADVIIAEESTRFCFPELRLGLIPGFGGTVRLRREVPNQKIRDLLFTGRSIQAKHFGEIVSQLVPNQKGLAIAKKTAMQMTKFHPMVVARAKKFIKPLFEKELEEEKQLFLEMIKDPIVLDALEKFVNDTGSQPYLP